MNQAIILELLLTVLPNSSGMTNIDLDQPNQVRFDWRGTRYRVLVESLCVEKVEGSLLGSDTTTSLIQNGLRNAEQLRDLREENRRGGR